MLGFEYEIKKSKRLGSKISISIKPGGKVIVSGPSWIPAFVLKKYVEEKSSWIKDYLKKMPQGSEKKNLSSGDKLLYFGQEIFIVISVREDIIRTKFDLVDNKFVVDVPSIYTTEERQIEIKKHLERWYIQQGIAVITDKVNKYTKLIGVNYSKISIKKVSSIWGSCSHDNSLSFNRKLIMAPHEIVDYVVIHEVCHIVHRDHSSRFWGLVCRHDPEFRSHRRWLKYNSHLLSI